MNFKLFQLYQPWVIKTYGDLAKTKTITNKKHERIIKALSGQEQNNPDSSKFRFWVKAKGLYCFSFNMLLFVYFMEDKNSVNVLSIYL